LNWLKIALVAMRGATRQRKQTLGSLAGGKDAA
jgi:hypothetical protein